MKCCICGGVIEVKPYWDKGNNANCEYRLFNFVYSIFYNSGAESYEKEIDKVTAVPFVLPRSDPGKCEKYLSKH